jgi:hypothetical protein
LSRRVTSINRLGRYGGANARICALALDATRLPDNKAKPFLPAHSRKTTAGRGDNRGWGTERVLASFLSFCTFMVSWIMMWAHATTAGMALRTTASAIHSIKG